MTFVTLRFRSLRALPSAPSTFGSQRSHHSAPNINSFLKTVTDFMKMLSGLGHPSFKSLAAYKNNKNVTDSFSKFFFPSKGPTEDIIFTGFSPVTDQEAFFVQPQSATRKIIILNEEVSPQKNLPGNFCKVICCSIQIEAKDLLPPFCYQVLDAQHMPAQKRGRNSFQLRVRKRANPGLPGGTLMGQHLRLLFAGPSFQLEPQTRVRRFHGG